MKILLVEDDEMLYVPLCRLLQENGYMVMHAVTLATARTMLSDADLVILDRGVPDGDGLVLLSDLRSRANGIPVIILSAKVEVADRVLGLDLGSDDYLTKPFEPAELLARIRAQLRKKSSGPKPQEGDDRIEFGPFVLDSVAHLVTYHSKEVAVTPKEFMLLRLFLQDPERVLSRETLLVKVWGIRFQSTRTVDVHMASLRQKFGNDTFETVHGIGYRLARGLSGLKN